MVFPFWPGYIMYIDVATYLYIKPGVMKTLRKVRKFSDSSLKCPYVLSLVVK